MVFRKIFIAVAAMAMSFGAVAQETAEDKLSFGLSLNHDAFFGFNPMMTASYELSDDSAITAYGIQWGAGTASAWGQWTEVGIGYNKTVGDFDINPQLGFTMGNLLSGGAIEGNRGIVGDGIVPNLTVNYGSEHYEGQVYAGYYAALRDNTVAAQTTLNYVHYWANFGRKISSVFSVGAHFEQLFLEGGNINGGGSTPQADYYTWVGPYVQLQKNGTGFRFSAGGDLNAPSESSSANDFYKLSFFTSF